MDLKEIQRRRTFAIVSHPDAGKTTLTEKLLLYGGAVQLAGSVTARKNLAATTSDWMELEKQRGISVSSTVLQFDYDGYCVNLLDTPGHRDFSEDTYRVITAVDSAVMVIDAAKGIERQTRKLFEVCRRQHLPIFTFMNKLDRPTRDPFALLDELEEVLGLEPCPMNWPVGQGSEFRGLFDRRSRQVHLFERVPGGAYRAPVEVVDPTVPPDEASVAPDLWARMQEELALLDGAGHVFDPEAVRRGAQTPVFFGSAVNNFGVQLLLDAFLDLAPPPQPRTARGREIDPAGPDFSGYVFKVQANMDPRHRDRLAFLRICSGRFERDMTVFHTRTGERVRLASSHRVFGRTRETVDEAYAGDVVGLVATEDYRIGDTLADDATLTFDTVPAFACETFAWMRSESSSQQKRFRKGLDQLLQEGVVRSFEVPEGAQRGTLLGAVGPLQFEVLKFRLQSEYGAEAVTEAAPFTVMRWILAGDVRTEMLPSQAQLATSWAGDPVILFVDEWTCRYFTGSHPEVRLGETPPIHGAAAPA